MGISGVYVNTFAEANIASSVNVSMNADLPHFWFEVTAIENGAVTLKDQGEVVTLPIHTNKNGEYVEYPMVSTWERHFRGGKPSIYRFVPFQGKRF